MEAAKNIMNNAPDTKEINPCNLSKSDSEKLQLILQGLPQMQTRLRCTCPCHRIYIHVWSSVPDLIKKKIEKIING